MLRIVRPEVWAYFLAFALIFLSYLIWKRKIRGIKRDKDIPMIMFLGIFIALGTGILIHFWV